MSLAAQPALNTSPASPAAEASTPTYARRVLLEALFLGGLADALLRDGPGLGLAIWMVVFAGMLVHLVQMRGHRLRREQWGWLGAAVLFASAEAWRDSMALRPVNFLAMLIALAILGATLMRGSIMPTILGQRVRDLLEASGAVVKQVIGGVLPLAFSDSALGAATQSWHEGRTRALIRASLITLPLLVVFGLLLSSADPLFEKLLALPALDWNAIASHLIFAGFFAWVVGGWLRGALIDDRPRTRLSDSLTWTLGTIEVTAVLGALVALFALFVGVQLGWLFGGERLVRSTTGLSYAEYARHGFFELVWVSLLVLPVLLGTRAAIRAEDSLAVERHRRLSTAVIVLVGGIMVSALGRMGLYVRYYGLSTDRLSATVFMVWLALVFGWFCATILRGRTRDFVAGMTVTGFATLAALNVANPGAIVARVNVSRASRALAVGPDSAASGSSVRPSPIDYRYLTADVDGDAVGVVVRALLAPPVAPLGTPARDSEVRERCDAVRNLLRSVAVTDRKATETHWRTWNAGSWRGARTIREHEAELRRVTCGDATGEAPFGNRDSRAAVPAEQWYRPGSPTPGLSGTSVR